MFLIVPFHSSEEIRNDIRRRMESSKRWLGPKKSKDRNSSSQQSRKRPESNNDDRTSKRPCNSTDRNEERIETVSPPKCSVKGCPLEYVGNYIANHVHGWIPQQKTNRLGFDYYVIYRSGCDKNTAVEGRDKFNGYRTLAIWAFKTGYYTKNVVESEDGKEILERLGIQNDPYSIFSERKKEMDTQVKADLPSPPSPPPPPPPPPAAAAAVPSQQPQSQTSAQKGASASSESTSDERQDDSTGVESESLENSGVEPTNLKSEAETESPLAGFKRFRETASNLKSMLSSAEEKRDEYGLKFFGHLCGWLEMKSSDTAFVMKFRSDNIDEAVQEFKSVMSTYEGTNDTMSKNLVEILIAETTKIFSAA